RSQVPLPDWRDDLEPRLLRGDGGLHPDLVVALGRGAMGYAVAAFLARRPHQLARDDVPAQGRAEEATVLVDGVCLQRGEGELLEEVLAAVEHLGRHGA